MTSMISPRYFIMKFGPNSPIDNVRYILSRMTTPIRIQRIRKPVWKLAPQRRQRVHKAYGDHNVWFSCSNIMLECYVPARWLTVHVQSAVKCVKSICGIFPSNKRAGVCVCVWNLVSIQDYSSSCGAAYPEDGEAGSPETSLPIFTVTAMRTSPITREGQQNKCENRLMKRMIYVTLRQTSRVWVFRKLTR